MATFQRAGRAGHGDDDSLIISCPECRRGDTRIAREDEDGAPDVDFICPDCGGTLDVD